MANLKFVLVLGLLFAISVAVLAETCNDETQVQEMNPEETTEMEPQQRHCGCGIRRRCCGICRFGRCTRCCLRNMEGEVEEEAMVEPQQIHCGCGRLRRCCGICRFGRCTRCCPRKMAGEEEAMIEMINI